MSQANTIVGTRRPAIAPGAPAAATRPVAKAAAPKPLPASDPIAKLHLIELHTARSVVGRQGPTHLITLALIAGLNVCFIGPPGTAKTYLVEKVTSSFVQPSEFFSTMLTKFSKPAEVVGPTDIKALSNGVVQVDTAGFLPSAKVAVLDEMFKGSSAILNALLTIANERRFKNGANWQACPTRLIVGMSNEFPEDPAQLSAYFDRFPIKDIVRELPDSDFEAMLTVTSAGAVAPLPASTKLTDADFAEIDRRRKAVQVPREIIRTIAELRALFRNKGIVISDRRWTQAVRVMQASAVYHGRTTIARKDLVVLESILWNDQNQIAVVKATIPDYLNPFGRALKEITDDVYAERKKIIDASKRNVGNTGANMVEAAGEAAKALGRIRSVTANLDRIEVEMTEDDKPQLNLARESIRLIEEAVTAIVKGKSPDIEALEQTASLDFTGTDSTPAGTVTL